jgi:glycosyltransferase involved in cell wall biosynthesis
MKKVVILLPTHWSAIQGGAEYQAKLICRHLIASGRFEVHWLSRRIHPDYQAQGYTIHRISDPAGLRGKARFFDYWALTRLLREIRPDVVYQRSGSAYTGIAARYARKSGCRLIWHVASDSDLIPFSGSVWQPKALLKYMDKAILEYGVRRASEIVVQTHVQHQLLQEHYGRQASMLVRNLHPLANETLDKFATPTVLWIANVKPNKQPEAFMRLGSACLDMPKVRFLMIGHPLPHAGLQSAFERAAAAIPNLTYLGRLPLEEVNVLIARSHVLVNTSLIEGFPNTFIQAWMRQVPVLSLNVDPDQLLEHQGIGFCARGDEAILLRTLRDWLNDESLRSSIGCRAQAYAQAEHSERNLEPLVELISGCV